MPLRITRKSTRPRASDRSMVATIQPYSLMRFEIGVVATKEEQLLRWNNPGAGHQTSVFHGGAGCREINLRIRRREKNVLDIPFYRSGVCAQNKGPAAVSPRNLAKARIEFILSSRSPPGSSSLIRFSHKSLPNTSINLSMANCESRTYDRSLYDVGSGNVPGPTDPSTAGSRRPFALLSESTRAVPDPEQRRKLCERWSFPTSTKL